MTTTLLPFAEAAFIAWAKTNVDIAAITTTIATKLGSTLPAIRVARIGDAPPEPWWDQPHLQIEAWAADQITASLLIRTFVAALPTIRNLHLSDGVIYTYRITSGPFWSPDDPAISTSARYILTVLLSTTKLPG